ncbi:hypothetical protein ASPBRDRAFT_127030 [Aspergillus brasiliensis CBS 101740]|uniref:HNH nuclease domain-containing protein n=1 Tax=Aspergillus brasiliensis (strain CBS 101740 / IMI 381727 / IBT 21946) TaxID=767769 RepID=A0A1L9UHA3_ASPBC|nr:hypothetical protein ASPBRDRAFT_127030 [Aspergillus brasiliensis CBS 101740]
MAQHPHQSFSGSPTIPLTLQQNQKAQALLHLFLQDYGLSQRVPRGYRPAKLILEMFEWVISKDAFLRFLFIYIYGNLETTDEAADNNQAAALYYLESFADGGMDPSKSMRMKGAIESFAEYIVDNFLLPFRASSAKTPQATPTALSSSQTPTQMSTTQRVSVLRKACLVRDHHRCVISRKFDIVEARKRSKEDENNCKDDDENLLNSEVRDGFQYLEVAHILPHNLTTMAQGEIELSESKSNVFRILDMFDPGLSHRLEGANIDRPGNALTLTHEYHRLFGEFRIFFEPTGEDSHEYRIDSLEDCPFLRNPLLPVIRTLSLSPNQTIDPPDSRLLRVHCAIAHIMKLSGAGEYIEKVVRDMEDEVDVKADGSTPLGHIIGLRLDGW